MIARLGEAQGGTKYCLQKLQGVWEDGARPLGHVQAEYRVSANNSGEYRGDSGGGGRGGARRLGFTSWQGLD